MGREWTMPGRARKAERMDGERAIIDIGSNTVRLVIYGGPPRAREVLLNEKVSARLGKGVAETGHLSAKASGSALAALARYAALLQVRGVQRVETVATAAVRDAENGADFLEAVAALGLKPRLLSGEEEATGSAMGVIAAFPDARGVVADLGGGSLELIHVDGEALARGASLPFGTLRLPALRADGPARFSRRIRKALDVAEWHCAPDESLFLVGGTYRALARPALEQHACGIDDPHGFTLSHEAAARLCRSVLRGKLPAAGSGIAASRLAALPDAAALLSVLLREINPARVVFSGWGLREGLLHGRLDPAVRRQNPLLAGVSAFTEALGSPPTVAAMVAGWTAGANPPASPVREDLRLAAIMLALASHRIEPNLRADHARDWALRKRWIGILAQDRALLAACLLANAGKASQVPALEALAPAADLADAVVWGLAVRLCRRLSGLAPQVLANSAISVEGPQLVLSLSGPYAALYADGAEKDLANLAARLNLQPSFRAT